MKQGPALVLFYKKLSENIFIGPCFLGLLLYVSGFMVFVYEGLGVFYLKQWWMFLVVGGITWVSIAFTWSYSRHKEVYFNVIANFNIKPDPEKLLKSFLSQIYDDFKIMVSTIPWAVAFILYILLAHERIVSVPQEIIENILLHPLPLTYAIILAYVAAYHVGMGSYLVIKHTLFVHNICRFPLKELTPLEFRRRTELHGLGQFSFLSSITWFVGLGIGILLTITIVNMITVTLLIILTAMGLMILLLPQLYLRKAIQRYKDEVKSEIIKRFRARWSRLDENLDRLDLITLCKLFNEVESIEEWPFGKGRIIQEALTSLIPLVTSLIGVIIRAP